MTLHDIKISWVAIENMHITLKYLGNTDVNLIPELNEVLGVIAVKHRNFRIKIQGLGTFGKNKRTNIIWLGIPSNEILNSLATDVVSAMQNFGFDPENRHYKAHLTLGRIKSTIDESIPAKLVQDYNKLFFQEFEVKNFVLYESLNLNGRLLYKVLNTYYFS